MLTVLIEPLPVGSLVVLAIFGVFTLLHLAFCYLEMEKWRKWTKPFCVALLSLAVILGDASLYLVAIGLVFGAIGDILLIFKHKVWTLVFGTLAFMVNHAFFIAQYAVMLGGLPWHLWAGLAFAIFVIVVVGIGLIHKVIKTPPLGFGALVYFSIIFADFYLACCAAANGYFNFLFLNVLGMLLFLGSDIYLTRTLFFRDSKRRDFYIMSTYLGGQLLVALGFLLTL